MKRLLVLALLTVPLSTTPASAVCTPWASVGAWGAGVCAAPVVQPGHVGVDYSIKCTSGNPNIQCKDTP